MWQSRQDWRLFGTGGPAGVGEAFGPREGRLKRGMGVFVGAGVIVGVLVGIAVIVGVVVGVAMNVGVFVGVAVIVGVIVGVDVAVALGVGAGWCAKGSDSCASPPGESAAQATAIGSPTRGTPAAWPKP